MTFKKDYGNIKSKRNIKGGHNMKNRRKNHYIAKGFSLILIVALIFLLGYGKYRDKMINKRAYRNTGCSKS